MQNRKFKKKYTVRIIVAVFLIVAALQMFAYANQVYRDYQTEQQIQKYEEENVGLAQENDDMKEFLKYLKTDAYKEKKAKEILNLKNPHESVVILKEDKDGEVLYEDSPVPEQVQGEPNHTLWWFYFFGED